ncbi:hypothetical protein MMC21_006007 [Puttea exsequens]|nr:hypothetical protein [Puttea exsequens]
MPSLRAIPTGKGRAKKDSNGNLVHRIGGVDIAFDPDLDIDKPKPTPLFPPYKVTVPNSLTSTEKDEVANYRALRESIHNGPLYTILGDNVRVGKSAGPKGKAVNPFEGMEKYSARYATKRRGIPKLDTRPYVLEFFPKELWAVLDPKAAEGEGVGNGSAGRRGKGLQIPGYEKFGGGEDVEGGEEGEERVEREDEGEGENEVLDEAYEDDEDGGDYNAEQYFDGGGDDGGDDYDGGDDGGGDIGL